MTLTYKKQKRETGLSAVGNPYPNTAIKLDSKMVGEISAPNWRSDGSTWRIRLMVVDGTSWKWIQLKARPNTEEEARAFVTANAAKIIALGLRKEEDSE